MATLLSIRLGKLERAASMNQLVRYDVGSSPTGSDGPQQSDRDMSEAEWLERFRPLDT